MMARKTGLIFLNMGVGSVLGLLANKLLSVYFGAGLSGQVDYALGIFGLTFFLTDLGMGHAHIKRVSEGRDPGDCFATFAVFKAFSTLVFILVSLGIILTYAVVLERPIESTTVPVLLIVLVYYVAKSLQEIAQSSFDARLETARSQTALFVDTLVRVVLIVIASLIAAALLHGTGPLAGRLDAQGPFWSWARQNLSTLYAAAVAGGGIAAAGLALTMLWRNLERGRFRWDLLRDYATFALPLFVSAALGTMAASIDTAALGFFLGAEETGLFGRVRRIPLLLAGIGTAVSILLFPSISAHSARGEHHHARRSADVAIRYLSMFLAPMVAFTIAFAEPIIRIAVADDFLSGAPAMIYLALYAFVVTLAIPHSNLLLGFGHARPVATLGAITAASIVVFDILLIPHDVRSLGLRLFGLGATGAALGTLLSGIIWYVGLRILSYRTVGYREHSHLWRHTAGAAAMAGVLLALDQVWPLVHWWHVPIYTLAGAAVYFAFLLLLRELRREDWKYFSESLHPVEMARYVRGEVLQRRR